MKLYLVHPTPLFVPLMLNSVWMVHSMFLISVVQLLVTLSTQCVIRIGITITDVFGESFTQGSQLSRIGQKLKELLQKNCANFYCTNKT